MPKIYWFKCEYFLYFGVVVFLLMILKLLFFGFGLVVKHVSLGFENL